ncbi:hypothetical protein [Nereida ignava]|uniref:hypothetical protein n=1 Tax=Nereida ignava TaxID=282199 RepID=UPI002FDFBB48
MHIDKGHLQYFASKSGRIMQNNVTFELASKSPIEVVYGLSAQTLQMIQSENKDVEGYDWCIVLNDTAEQREEFMSGNDVDDAQLIITDQDGQKKRFRFLSEIDCEYEDDLSDVIQYKEDSFHDAGSDLDASSITHIIVARIEPKFRSWKFVAKIEGDFAKEKVTLKIKNRDSEIDPASEIYGSWASDFENSIEDIYYDDLRIPFEVDFTSYPPEFLCLKKTSNGWKRDTELEHFFEGIQ